MKRLNMIIFFLLISSLSFIGCTRSGSDSNSSSATIEIQIGALIPLTGFYENQGDEILAALNCAVEDVNALFENENKPTRINLVYSDTATTGILAQEHINTFITQGIRMIIGPLTSVEVDAVKDEINASDSLLISPSSTMTSLAINNDNIYRIVPDDSNTVEATVDVMWELGIRNIIMFYKDNAWGEALASLTRDRIEAKGGSYIGEVTHIGMRGSELREYLAEISVMVGDAIAANDPSTVAIQMISMDTGAYLLELASEDATLGAVKWFGCDGFVNSDELFHDDFTNGVTFAKQVEFTSPIFGSPATANSQAVSDRITAVTGSAPNVYSLLSYDALMIAALSLDEAGESASLAQLTMALESAFSTYSGLTGTIDLNNAGDRDSGSYYFWKVVDDGGMDTWKHVLTYTDGVIDYCEGGIN